MSAAPSFCSSIFAWSCFSRPWQPFPPRCTAWSRRFEGSSSPIPSIARWYPPCMRLASEEGRRGGGEEGRRGGGEEGRRGGGEEGRRGGGEYLCRISVNWSADSLAQFEPCSNQLANPGTTDFNKYSVACWTISTEKYKTCTKIRNKKKLNRRTRKMKEQTSWTSWLCTLLPVPPNREYASLLKGINTPPSILSSTVFLSPSLCLPW